MAQSDEEEPEPAAVPDDSMDDSTVERTEWEYSDRGPNDYVATRTGPSLLSQNLNPTEWARSCFGSRLKHLKYHPDIDLWVALVRKP